MLRFKSLEVRQCKRPNHTYWFIVCLKYKYAKDFKERGVVRFGMPSEWQKITDGTLRGDKLEGVYASMAYDNQECFELLSSLRTSPVSFKQGGVTYFQSSEVMNYWVYCMFGLHDFNMPIRDKRSQDHRYYRAGIIPFHYFRGLFPEWDKDRYRNSMDGERPAVLLINPIKFKKLVYDSLLKRGIKTGEIYFSPVIYSNYKEKSFIIPKAPTELFNKDNAYKDQSEVRFVIDTTRKEVRDMFDSNDGILELGPIGDDVATLSEFYFEDMQVEIRDNEILYSLAKPIEGDLTPYDLITVLHQALSDELPQSPMTIEQMEAAIARYSSLLSEKFSLEYDRSNHYLKYEGKIYNLASTAAARVINHYYQYVADNDIDSARQTVVLFRHFSPMYSDYFDRIKEL